MDIKEVFKGLLAIIVVGGAIASLFYTVNDTGEQLIQLLATRHCALILQLGIFLAVLNIYDPHSVD